MILFQKYNDAGSDFVSELESAVVSIVYSVVGYINLWYVALYMYILVVYYASKRAHWEVEYISNCIHLNASCGRSEDGWDMIWLLLEVSYTIYFVYLYMFKKERIKWVRFLLCVRRMARGLKRRMTVVGRLWYGKSIMDRAASDRTCASLVL